MDNKEKEFANRGCHYLSDTNYSPKGKYFGFTPTSSDVAITDIVYREPNINSGDIKSIGMVVGLFYPIAGGFSKIKLSAGSMMLYKDRS